MRDVEKTLLPETERKKLELPEGATYADAVALAVILWEQRADLLANGGVTAQTPEAAGAALVSALREIYGLDSAG